ncbi:MAG: DUF5020 family protein [Calditrichaeota bacterium]|nr:DUF5020 family protein [Calditrichota bacterium]MCB9367765.1 DUF5020 family protein [Calditrichota bacterium]
MRLLAFCLLIVSASQAADTYVNTQLHRDFDREIFTSTTEIWSGDKLGSTFFFTDLDFTSTGNTQSYFEISRHFILTRIRKLGHLNASIQFNDGVTGFDEMGGKVIPRTLLGGIAVTELKSGNAVFEVQALLRQEFAADLGWQLTGVWFVPIGKSPFEFLGYVDWNSNHYGNQPVSIQTEPQFQYRWRQMALGTEWEISRNFAGAFTKKDGYETGKWYLHPTIYVRYDF